MRNLDESEIDRFMAGAVATRLHSSFTSALVGSSTGLWIIQEEVRLVVREDLRDDQRG